MAATAVVDQMEDRSVRALGPDGGLRRRRFSQQDAKALLARKVVLAKWNHDETRILFIQFFGDQDRPDRPNRWHKTGTRYSFPETVGAYDVWSHKPLPYRAMDAQLGYTEPRDVIETQVRMLFSGVQLSIAAAPKKRARVVSIEAGLRNLQRKKQGKSAPASVVLLEKAA